MPGAKLLDDNGDGSNKGSSSLGHNSNSNNDDNNDNDNHNNNNNNNSSAMSVAVLPGGMLGARSRLRPLPLSLVGWCASCINKRDRKIWCPCY